MKIFKCDLCKRPFEYAKDSVNNIKFFNKEIRPKLSTHYSSETVPVTLSDAKFPKESNPSGHADFDICPFCYQEIRQTIELLMVHNGLHTSENNSQDLQCI